MERVLISSAVLAIAVAGVSTATAAPGTFKVTGGGQIIGSDAQGAGDTVGFTAHRIGEGPAAKGQFQFVPRGQSGNASAPQEKFHGVVTCLISGAEAQAAEAAEEDGEQNEALMPGSARFGGYLRDDPEQSFTVDVTDNGQGAGATGSDAIVVRLTAEACADNPEKENDEPEELLALGRGNVKIHNNPDSGTTTQGGGSGGAGKGKGKPSAL